MVADNRALFNQVEILELVVQVVEETKVIQLDLVKVTLLWQHKVKQILVVEVDLQCIQHVTLQDHM